MLGETGSQEAGKGADGKKAKQMEEERPTLDDPRNRAKHPGPQDPPSLEEVVQELQRRKEAEEQN